MKTQYTSILLLILILAACEQPNSPDFKLDQKIQTPLMSERTYQFLGGSSALVDTTDPDFDSYFSIVQEGTNKGLVRLSKEENFDFGKLDGAIPEIDVTPTSVKAGVGALSLGSFSSQGDDANLGSASFQDITGFPPPPPGTPITTAGSTPSPANINIQGTDYFTSATIKDGELLLVFQNNLGFNLSDVTIDLRSGTTFIASGSSGPVNNASEGTVSIPIPEGSVLKDLNVDVSASWPGGQNMQDNSNELVVNEVKGKNLVASQVKAAIESQGFSTSGAVNIDDSSFRFNKPGHYVEIDSGELRIDQIINEIDLGIDTLVISFPGIRRAPYSAADSLSIRFEGSSSISRAGSGSSPAKSIDLSDVRIFAEGNQLTYNITGSTENTQQGSGDIRTINENDQMGATVEINNLTVREAFGVVVSRNVIVNDNDPSNDPMDGSEAIDLFNDEEAEAITIDALQDISDQLDGIEFANPELSIRYLTNIGVPTTIYASIVGIDASGNRVYLKGQNESGGEGGPHYVTPSEIPEELIADGFAVDSDQLIKFSISPSQDSSSPNFVTFNRQSTNVNDFLNNLPSDIRLISVATVNELMEEGTITDPVEFDPSMSVDIPLNLAANSASYSDTVEADLSDLPDPQQDDQRLTEGKIYIEYTNNLPLGTELNLVMLDANGNEVTRIPSSSEDPLTITPGTVDSGTGFVTQASTGNLTISLNQDQLDQLNKTTDMEFKIGLNTDENRSSVRLRAEDTISIKISLSAAVESTVN